MICVKSSLRSCGAIMHLRLFLLFLLSFSALSQGPENVQVMKFPTAMTFHDGYLYVVGQSSFRPYQLCGTRRLSGVLSFGAWPD